MHLTFLGYDFYLLHFLTVIVLQYLCFHFLFHPQDPAEADKLLKIQRELDETKIILVCVNATLLQLFYFGNCQWRALHFNNQCLVTTASKLISSEILSFLWHSF